MYQHFGDLTMDKWYSREMCVFNQIYSMNDGFGCLEIGIDQQIWEMAWGYISKFMIFGCDWKLRNSTQLVAIFIEKWEICGFETSAFSLKQTNCYLLQYSP